MPEVYPVMFGPNITGYFREAGDDLDAGGCIQTTQTTGGWVDAGSGGLRKRVDIDASRSSSSYGRSTTVQPASIRFIPAIKF